MSRRLPRPKGLFIGLCALACGLLLAACADEFQRTEPEQLPEPTTTYDVSAESPPVVASCGNGEDDPGEECDDGNGINTDGCTNTCRLTPAPLCVPCSNDGDCGRDVDLCLDLGDDSFCARDCTDLPCPRGYECREILEGEEVIAEQCAPPDDVCPECPDDDGDGVCNGDDICPFGDDDADEDADGNPDACELCPGEDDTVDSDRDGIPDGCDCGGLGADCSVNAFCFVGDGDPTCECRPGFTGDGISCQDINECAEGTDNCADEADCINTLGGFMCVCGEGFSGDGLTCTDIDECATDADDCVDPAVCTNTVGSFICSCAAGFIDTTGDATACIDINECALAHDDCDPVAECTNTPGGFTCTCPDGYDPGDTAGTTCTDVDECATETDDCGDNAMCFNTVGSFDCLCSPGYEGDGHTCALTDRVVHFPAHSQYSPLVTEWLELDPVLTNTSSELTVELRTGAALAVVEGTDNLIASVESTLLAWVGRGGKLIVTTERLDEHVALASGLGIDLGDTVSGLLSTPEDAPVDVLNGIRESIAPSVPELTPASDGDAVLGQVPGDEPAGVATLTRGGLVVTNGLPPGSVDFDSDGDNDFEEILRNEYVYLLTPETYPVFNGNFDHSARGWRQIVDEGLAPQWSADDSAGSADSGSALFATTAEVDTVLAAQCIPIDRLGVWRLRASLRAPDPGGATGQVVMAMAGVSGGCSVVDSQTTGDGVAEMLAQADWGPFEGDAGSPEIALPAETDTLLIVLSVEVDSTPAQVSFDDLRLEPGTGCADETLEEIFEDNMIGCGGAVVWADRDDLCAGEWTPCTAQEWVSRRNGAGPSNQYWTDDFLYFGDGGSSGTCAVSLTDTEKTLPCDEGDNMLVCTAADAADSFGNDCFWHNCGLESTDNLLFGGCAENNETAGLDNAAGTLCCRPFFDL